MNGYSRVCTGASVTAAPINTGRKHLVLQNQSPVSSYWVGFGTLATQDGFSLEVAPQSELVFTAPDCPTERIEVNGPSGVIATIMEG